MTPKDRTYLSCHFHDFVCVDWQYSRAEQRLQLRIREDWDNEENSDAFLLKFEGIRYYSMEAENHFQNFPLFWIISTTAFTTSERKKRLEKQFDEPLYQYEICLENGYVEIICADIHAERLKEDPPPYTPDSSWTPPPPPEPFPPEEREARILNAAQSHTYPSADYYRAEETLLLMEENKDPALPCPGWHGRYCIWTIRISGKSPSVYWEGAAQRRICRSCTHRFRARNSTQTAANYF